MQLAPSLLRATRSSLPLVLTGMGLFLCAGCGQPCSRTFGTTSWSVGSFGTISVYKTQERVDFPPSTAKFLEWHVSPAETRTFLINDSHAGYEDVELRIRDDGKAIWLVENRGHTAPAVRAILHLEEGWFYGESAVYFWERRSRGDPRLADAVKWATVDGGHELKPITDLREAAGASPANSK